MWDSHKNDFPVLRHNPELAYLDYAATTFMPDEVISIRNDYDENIGASLNRGIGPLAKKAEKIFSNSTEYIKYFWNATDDYELVYTKNATESINLLATSLETRIGIGDIILLSEYEHHSNLLPWQRVAALRKACVVLLPITADGELDYSLLDILPKERIKIISLSLVSNVTGYKINIQKIREFTRNTNIIWILDVSQAVGHIHLDFDKISADAYCMSAHKMYGPKNIGGCFIKKQTIELLEPYMLGGGMVWNMLGGHPEWRPGAAKFEAGTFDVSLVQAWSAACAYISEIGFQSVVTWENLLYDKFLFSFRNDDRIEILPSGPEKKNICSFEIKGKHPHDIAALLSSKTIELRTGHMCSQSALNALNKCSVCRISWGIGTEEADIDKLILVLHSIICELPVDFYTQNV